MNEIVVHTHLRVRKNYKYLNDLKQDKMNRCEKSQLFELISDLIFLSSLYIIMIYLIYNYTTVFGIPISSQAVIKESTLLGNINQFNFFTTVFYLPMYILRITLKENIVLILGIFLYIFGMYDLNIFKKLTISITNVNNRRVILISSYLSMLILIFSHLISII